MKHTRLFAGIPLFFLLFAFIFPVSAEEPEVMPSDFLRSWDPITLIFDSAVGPEGGGPADDPGVLFSLNPDHPGEFRWTDSRTLQFLPADPWPPLETLRVRSGAAETVLRTLMVPPERVTPRNGAVNLDPIDRIELVLSEWVDPDKLHDMIDITLRPLPGLSGQGPRRIGGDEIHVRAAEPRPGSPKTTVSVELAEPVGYGTKIDLTLRLADGAAADAYAARYSFSTRPLFRLTDMGSGGYRLPVSAGGSAYSAERAVAVHDRSTPLFLQFSEKLGSLSMEEVRRLVRFSPTVSNFHYRIVNNRIYLYVEAEAEVPYTLFLEHQPILSASGRVLAPFGTSRFSFYFEALKPYIRWERGGAVVERYGPKVFPMEGRGVSKVDLRIHRIDPLDPRFWPFPSSALSINEESRPPMPGEPVNTLERVVRSLGSPSFSSIIDLPIGETSPSTGFGLDLTQALTAVDGSEAAGTYLVGYRALGSDAYRHYVRTVVTDLNVTAVEEEHAVVFFVTSLSTGEPIRGAEIRLEAAKKKGEGYEVLVRGTTDSSGRFRYNHTRALDRPLRRIVVVRGSDVLVFDPSKPPPSFRNNHWFGSGTRWLSWLNQDPVTEREEAVYRGYLMSERPIYRPGETVHLLGYVRSRKAGEIDVDARDVERRVDVNGPGDRRWTYEAGLDDFGQFAVDFDEEDVPTGRYTARLYDDSDTGTLATVDFQIESYRVPRFEVQIHGEERVPVDEPFSLELTAEYYAGGRVAGRPVHWQLTESPFSPHQTGFEGFTFSSYESIGGGASGRSSGITRQNMTDENGLAALEVDPGARRNPTAVRYVVEGTVEGADGQRVTAVKAVQALPPFSVGIKQERFVRNVQKLQPEVVVLDFDGEPKAGKEYSVRLYRRQWHSYLTESDFVTGKAEYRSDVVDELVLEEKRISKDKAEMLEYPLAETGVYVIELLARDELGRLQTVRVDCYVPGTSPVAWERTEGNVFETTADKDEYVPGNTARVLIRSPFQEAAALVVVEGPEKVSYEWIEITGGQAVFELPISARMVPRVPVHFLLSRGRVPGTENRYTPSFDRGRPIALANTTWLTVLPTEHELYMDLDYPATNLPGSTVTMEITMTDASGKPADGQAALWLVDRAVLSLAQEKKIAPLEAFIDPVESSVSLRDTRNEVVGNLPFRENPGGGGWEENEAAKRSAGEPDLLDRTTVRRNFKTVPYYNPRIPVKNGKALVEIELPDNLTDFAVRAAAVSGYSRFGTASGLLSIRLPVIVQTALPRFVRPGDSFSAGGVARIVEGPGGKIGVQVKTDGLQVAGGYEYRRSDLLEKGVSTRQYFDFSLPPGTGAEQASVSLGVERLSDGVSDAFEVALPVRSGVPDEHRLTIVPGTPGVARTFPVDAHFMKGTLRQHFTVAGDEASLHSLSSLDYFGALRPDTTEQRTGILQSRFLMAELLARADRKSDAAVTQRNLEDFLDYLDTVRTPSGLYAQFPGGKGLVSITAGVLEVFTLAEAAGLKPNGTVRDRVVRALQDALRSDYRYLVSGYEFQERVEALAALGRAGFFDESYGGNLLGGAGGQNLYACALLVTAYAEQGRSDDSRVRELLSSLKKAEVFRLEGGQRYFTGLVYRQNRWGGYLMTSRVRTVAAVIRALTAVEPRNGDLEPMRDYLLRQGSGLGWGSTADTLEVLKTLSSQARTGVGPSAGGRRFVLNFGPERLVMDTEGGRIDGVSSGAQVPGTVTGSGTGGRDPWVCLEAMYRRDVPPSAMEGSNNGFVVNRELQVVEAGRVVRRLPVRRTPLELPADTLLEEHVTVSNPENRNYVAVRIPLAAGCEPLNPELETSGAEARALGSFTMQATYARYLDDEVIYYYEMLPQGTYHFYFRQRAVFAGSFQLPPASARCIYDPEVRGNSPGALLSIHGD